MAVPSFTVLLNNYTFFLKHLIVGSTLKIVKLLYDASTTFNVAVQYLQCKHLRCSPKAGYLLYMRALIFPINRNEKSACILYTSVYYRQDFMVIEKYVKSSPERVSCLETVLRHLSSVLVLMYDDFFLVLVY